MDWLSFFDLILYSVLFYIKRTKVTVPNWLEFDQRFGGVLTIVRVLMSKLDSLSAVLRQCSTIIVLYDKGMLGFRTFCGFVSTAKTSDVECIRKIGLGFLRFPVSMFKGFSYWRPRLRERLLENKTLRQFSCSLADALLCLRRCWPKYKTVDPAKSPLWRVRRIRVLNLTVNYGARWYEGRIFCSDS